jgi:hypothetical protein
MSYVPKWEQQERERRGGDTVYRERCEIDYTENFSQKIEGRGRLVESKRRFFHTFIIHNLQNLQ